MKQPDKTPEQKKTPVCTWCNKPATRQTTKGKHAQEAGQPLQNHGWFCDKCWDEGEAEERLYIYGA